MSLTDIKNTIARAVKKGDLFDKIICLAFIKLGYSNDKLQALEIRNKKFCYIKEKYGYLINKFVNLPISEKKKDKIIWILWFQGYDAAPDIVKKCIDSIYHYKGVYEVIFLTSNNIINYIDIPEYILKKWKKGIISNTHFSDIVRTDILVRHGGIWLDATTYLTDFLPTYVTDTSFFVYKRGVERDKSIVANNWLISANKNVRLLICVREMLFEYWKKENKIRDYFLWHLCFTIATHLYKEDWNEVCWITDTLGETLRWNLFKNKNKNTYDEITKLTGIHKLSYKIDVPDNIDGSIYEHIINNKGL